MEHFLQTFLFLCIYSLMSLTIDVNSEIYFEFEQDCSFELASKLCVQCFHDVWDWNETPEIDCSQPDIRSKLPDPVIVERVFAVNSSGSFNFILTLSANFTNLQALDMRILWLKSMSGKHYGNGQHQSTLKFFKPLSHFGSFSKLIRFNVTFYGVFPFGMFNFQGVSRPSCYGSGVSPWAEFKYHDLENILQSYPERSDGSKNFRQKESFKVRSNCSYNEPIDVKILERSEVNDADDFLKYFLIAMSVSLLGLGVFFLIRYFNKFDWSIEFRSQQREAIMVNDDGAIIHGSTWRIMQI